MQTAISDDGFESALCPLCGMLLRDDAGALVCSEHGVIHSRPTGVVMPPEFDGRDISDR